MLFTRDRRGMCTYTCKKKTDDVSSEKRDEEETGEENFAQRDLTQTKPEERVNHGQRTS